MATRLSVGCLVICLVMQFLLNKASEFVAALQHGAWVAWFRKGGCQIVRRAGAGSFDHFGAHRHRPDHWGRRQQGADIGEGEDRFEAEGLSEGTGRAIALAGAKRVLRARRIDETFGIPATGVPGSPSP